MQNLLQMFLKTLGILASVASGLLCVTPPTDWPTAAPRDPEWYIPPVISESPLKETAFALFLGPILEHQLV